jgi:hypothetical protein
MPEVHSAIASCVRERIKPKITEISVPALVLEGIITENLGTSGRGPNGK